MEELLEPNRLPSPSHYGSTATPSPRPLPCGGEEGLHPTMVRLQPTRAGSGIVGQSASPSHYGSTATFGVADRKNLPGESLHPTMVRLQQSRKLISFTLRSFVSIPLWFDCNVVRPSFLRMAFKVSIPLWFDCNLPEKVTALFVRSCLHPTMVRLQLHRGFPNHARCHLSPSHYGSTATRRRPTACSASSGSPSHYGSTATPVTEGWQVVDGKRLHPTMVRLQQKGGEENE